MAAVDNQSSDRDGSVQSDENLDLRGILRRQLTEVFTRGLANDDRVPTGVCSRLSDLLAMGAVTSRDLLQAITSGGDAPPRTTDPQPATRLSASERDPLGDRLRKISFTAFRGLPDNECDLRGRSIVIWGENGAGKSGIVDGIEFFYSGDLRAFRGRGTGGVRLEDAIAHILCDSPPSITVRLQGSNTPITRTVGTSGFRPQGESTARHYLSRHPSVEAFILRRAQLLDFIHAPDADRYQKLVGLLGLQEIDESQAAFNEAEESASSSLSRAEFTFTQLLQRFQPPDATTRPPRSRPELLAMLTAAAESVGVDELATWDDLPAAVSDLGQRRSEATREALDRLNAALTFLDRPFSWRAAELHERMQGLHDRHAVLREASPDGPKAKVIDEGISYFERETAVSACPLCQRPLPDEGETFLTKLKERAHALKELLDMTRQWDHDASALMNEARRVDRLLREERLLWRSHDGRSERKAIVEYRRWLRQWTVEFAGTITRGRPVGVTAPPDLAPILTARASFAESLRARHVELSARTDKTLEQAYQRLRLAVELEPQIREAEQRRDSANSTLRVAGSANTAFNTARETGLQFVLDSISETVQSFYDLLHAAPHSGEEAECKQVDLSQTGRAARGGLSLRIRFFERDDCDPRAFLSEGHLDSLGLCIYLATARLFNPPGSLLVLDDVLTSIDRNHRSRVRDLLISRFSDFQLVVTTHDRRWFDLLQAGVQAVDRSCDWRFVQYHRCSLEAGPESSQFENTWQYIDEQLGPDADPEAYRNLGGPLRVVFEDFLKRVAEKMELRVRFRCDGLYTAGEFVFAGIFRQIRSSLLNHAPDDEESINVALMPMFDSALVNILSHDNPDRLELPRQEVADFVSGLKHLRRCCEQAQIMRGPT